MNTQDVTAVPMKLTAVIEREDEGYGSLCAELDEASQGKTIEEACDNLREALELFFESALRKSAGEAVTWSCRKK